METRDQPKLQFRVIFAETEFTLRLKSSKPSDLSKKKIIVVTILENTGQVFFFVNQKTK